MDFKRVQNSEIRQHLFGLGDSKFVEMHRAHV